MRKLYLIRAAAMIAIVVASVLGTGWANAAQISEKAVNAAFNLNASTIQKLAISQRVDGSLATAIAIDGQMLTLNLQEHSVRSDDFQVLVQYDYSDQLVPAELPPVTTYRGEVSELDGAVVSASYVNDKLTATIMAPAGDTYIEPLAGRDFDNADGWYVVYRAEDVVPNDQYKCGSTNAMRFAEIDGVPGITVTGNKITDLAIDADYLFYQANGSSIPNTVNDVENVLNTVEAKYEIASIQITYEVTTIVVRTVEVYSSNDSYTLLCQFRSRWNGVPESYIRRDTAHLFTGRALNGNIIGIAWLGVICNTSGFDCSASGNLGYGLSESRFSTNFSYRVALTAHEIGHNWNASHCDGDSDCSIMCSAIGGCPGGVNQFSSRSISEINAYENTRTCLTVEPDPIAVPFSDDFPSTTLNTDKWVYNNAIVINSNAVNEPSGLYSLNLDAAGTQDYRDDDIRSGFILLNGQSNLNFSYYVERIGVESGEQLVVEYWTSLRAWQEVNRITSDGVDQGSFSYYTHLLGSNAYHNEFRIRFRAEVNDVADEWYIDDVSVGTGTPQPNVSVDIIPNNPPITVPPGGSFTYTGVLTNNLNQISVTDVWVMVNVPNYGLIGPVLQANNIVLGYNQILTYPGISQSIPGNAPAGLYGYIAYCGDNPLNPIDSSSFNFTVSVAAQGDANDWVLAGWFGGNEEGLPLTTNLIGNYPNPFNATTSFQYSLETDSDVKLEVYNLIGQKVATVVDAHQDAGIKNIQFDASQLSSGIYFYKLKAGGQSFTKRMALLK